MDNISDLEARYDELQTEKRTVRTENIGNESFSESKSLAQCEDFKIY